MSDPRQVIFLLLVLFFTLVNGKIISFWIDVKICRKIYEAPEQRPILSRYFINGSNLLLGE